MFASDDISGRRSAAERAPVPVCVCASVCACMGALAQCVKQLFFPSEWLFGLAGGGAVLLALRLSLVAQKTQFLYSALLQLARVNIPGKKVSNRYPTFSTGRITRNLHAGLARETRVFLVEKQGEKILNTSVSLHQILYANQFFILLE